MSRNWINGPLAVATALSLMLAGGCSTLGSKRNSASDADEHYPAAAANRYLRALGYMDAGDDARAMREFEMMGDAYPEYSGPLVNLGIIHWRNGRPDAAMAALERAITVCRKCAAANNQLGILQRQQGRFEAAEKSYQRAIAADPDYALAYYNLGVLYDLYNGRPDLAVRHYQAYVDRASDPQSIKLVEMWIADLNRRFGESRRTARAE